MVETLHNLSDLRNSKFGQPDPRHGLRLLWWFAREFVLITSNGFYSLHDPANGAFGFRLFRNVERILPYSKYRYYKTGNLRFCDSLPHYVRINYTGNSEDRNTDRIIVSVCSRWNGKIWFDQIYVTKHLDPVRFDPNHTYNITPDLLKHIKNLNLEDFLYDMKHKRQNSPSVRIELYEDSSIEQYRDRSTGHDCHCGTLGIVLTCVFLLMVLIIVIILLFLFFKSKV